MNPATATIWTPGLVMLAVGIVAALAYLFGSKRLKSEAPAPETLDDLDARYQALLGQLRAHVANKHLLPAAEFEATRAELERSAADVLRAREGKKAQVTRQAARAEKQANAPQTFAQKNPMLMGGLVGAGVVGFFAVLGWQLQSSATARTDGMQATGTVPPGGDAPMQQPRRDDKLEALAGRVQANPEDVDAIADLAVYLIRRQAFQDAKPLVDRAMLIDAFHPKARSGRAVMRAIEGDLRGAIDDLERLANRYPEAYDSFMFAGMLALEDNDLRRAETNLEAYVNMAPLSEQPPMFRQLLVQIKQQLAAQP